METSLKNILKVTKVLYIDKQDNVSKPIQNTLNIFFKKVYYANSITQAIDIYNHDHPDLIISEVHLKGESCLPILHNIRQYSQNIPIIITSENKNEEVLFEAIRLQLIDFLVKPVSIDKFIFVLNKVAKYILHHGQVIVYFGDYHRYNYIAKTVKIGKSVISLTKNESRLIELLLANTGKVISKKEIELHIWGEEFITESAFKSLFKRIRDKIGKDTIKNSSGHGYYLN
ncbi:MAG: response regulator [Campylobacterota bacterium]|nr:response regulator [Campylobacterota bacterium]